MVADLEAMHAAQLPSAKEGLVLAMRARVVGLTPAVEARVMAAPTFAAAKEIADLVSVLPQRKVPFGADDEEALTEDIIALARQYGRYGYRRVTALLHAAGWSVNHMA